VKVPESEVYAKQFKDPYREKHFLEGHMVKRVRIAEGSIDVEQNRLNRNRRRERTEDFVQVRIPHRNFQIVK
jgi:hypothetical protein